jgi:hypothetical protein
MTIVIRKAGIRRYNVNHYAPGLAPYGVAQMKSLKLARQMGEWYALRMAQETADAVHRLGVAFAA